MATWVRNGYVAECFWPGVREADLHQVDQRIRALAGAGAGVHYLGWHLVIDDEVVWLEFDGPLGPVRRIAEQAQIPFGRILRVARAPDPPAADLPPADPAPAQLSPVDKENPE